MLITAYPKLILCCLTLKDTLVSCHAQPLFCPLRAKGLAGRQVRLNFALQLLTQALANLPALPQHELVTRVAVMYAHAQP